MYLCTLFYILSLFLTLRAVVSFSFYLHHRGIKFCLRKTHARSSLLYYAENNYSTNPWHWNMQLFFCIKMNLRPLPSEKLRSITVGAEGTHSSDSLKHGFRFHRMFTTRQKKKKLYFQRDLHRLVPCKADLHVTVDGLILDQAEFNSRT
jgi:hypothetical protein